MSDFDSVSVSQAKTLTRAIHSTGIPPSLRGMVWLLLSKGKNPHLEATYFALQESQTAQEKQITRDLARTFPSHEYFEEGSAGQASLFNVLKAYSIYDVDVGYCQGISFVVGALLLNVCENFVIFRCRKRKPSALLYN